MKRYVIMTGGLGNQMFQYAFLKRLRHEGIETIADISMYNCGVEIHNGFELYSVFDIDDVYVSRRGLNLMFLKFLRIFRFRVFYVDKDIYEHKSINKKIIFYDGFWQNEENFRICENEIRKVFSFHNVNRKNQELAAMMQNENSISLHCRRGDYLGNIELGGICTSEYYKKAIELMASRVKDAKFYIFSDDPKWACQHFKDVKIDYCVIDFNRGVNSYLDMFLMTQCKHHIISNSSFSWWGAWLGNQNDQIVIAPRKWSNKDSNLCPQLSSWILI